MQINIKSQIYGNDVNTTHPHTLTQCKENHLNQNNKEKNTHTHIYIQTYKRNLNYNVNGKKNYKLKIACNRKKNNNRNISFFTSRYKKHTLKRNEKKGNKIGKKELLILQEKKLKFRKIIKKFKMKNNNNKNKKRLIMCC